MKNLHLDLVRVTEAGAIEASVWVGRGNKEEADKVATELMRERLNQMDFVAEIAIGEGIKDDSFGLYKGERVGSKRNYSLSGSDYSDPKSIIVETQDQLQVPEYSIAVDPIEGTTPVSKGGPEAMSVIALAEKGCFFETDSFYMNKFCVGPEVLKTGFFTAAECNIKTPIQRIVSFVATALNKPINAVTVCILDRPRHSQLVVKLRSTGCRIKFIQDCDVTACIATCVPDSGIDIYLGVGGSPEAVIAAAAVKCMGGLFQAQIANDTCTEFEDKIYIGEELAKGNVMFSATGITDGQLLKGVRYGHNGKPTTHSITMRSESGTIREVITRHGN